jgi:hypothetical protein
MSPVKVYDSVVKVLYDKLIKSQTMNLKEL